MSDKKATVVPGAEQKMDKFKEEVARELGVDMEENKKYQIWGRVPAERCGEVGGNMVKKMVESYEKKLID
jgi:hypothetical protein